MTQMAADKRAEFDLSAAAALATASLCVGVAIHLHDGEYSPGALLLITAALLSTGWAICSRARPAFPRRTNLKPMKILGATLALLLIIEFVALFMAWPGVDLPVGGRWQLLPFQIGLGLSLVWLAVGYAGQMKRAWFPLLIATQLMLGIWMVRLASDPRIDVWVFQQDAASALLDGRNPYTMTFPDIYHSTLPGHQEVYGKGLVANDRVQFGFPYPPVSLVLATIGYAIAHDHRYAQAAALAIAGCLIGFSRPGVIPKLAAALLVFTPRAFFILGRAWTEPFTVMLLAATIFLACRRPAWTWLGLGLVLATKQYMVLALPITFFLLPTGWKWIDWLKLLAKAAIVAMGVTLPMALWNFPAFWKSTVTVQELAPFRWDALSYLVWYGFRGHLVTEPSTALFWSTFAAVVALGLALWKSPRTPAGFAASLALILLCFFSFNKQAFCNYYFFVIGALCCGIGAIRWGADPKTAQTVSSL
jgi:hypothetical protein